MTKKLSQDEELQVTNSAIIAIEDHLYKVDLERDKVTERYNDICAEMDKLNAEYQSSDKKRKALVAKRQRLCKALGY